VFAFLGTSAKGLHAATFESLFPGRRRPLDVATLRLTREPGPGSAAGTSRVLVPFHVEPRTGFFGPGSRLLSITSKTMSFRSVTSLAAFDGKAVRSNSVPITYAADE